MKRIVAILASALLCSCINIGGGSDVTSHEDPEHIAVVLSKTDFENSIAIENAQEVVESAKIYITGNYIFINDKRRGFHIFDNTDPNNPVKKKFLKAPGATDIAIRDNICYINQATDLVVLTLNFDTFSFTLNERMKNVFPEIFSPFGYQYSGDDRDNVVVVNWIKK